MRVLIRESYIYDPRLCIPRSGEMQILYRGDLVGHCIIVGYARYLIDCEYHVHYGWSGLLLDIEIDYIEEGYIGVGIDFKFVSIGWGLYGLEILLEVDYKYTPSYLLHPPVSSYKEIGDWYYI